MIAPAIERLRSKRRVCSQISAKQFSPESLGNVSPLHEPENSVPRGAYGLACSIGARGDLAEAEG
jgi:hypothetical protein